MELYTIRWNLYNYIIKDNFDYINIKEYIFLWKNGLIMLFIFLLLIFLYKFNEIKFMGFMIILVFILFIYYIYFELGYYIDDIQNNKYLMEYGDYYNLCNIIYNEASEISENDYTTIESSKTKVLAYLREYREIQEIIKRNMKYEDNKNNNEIANEYYNIIKKNNDLLKYVNIYSDIDKCKKYLFIKENKDFAMNDDSKEVIIINGINYYLIDLEELNKTEKNFLKYINNKYETNYKNFNILFEKFDLRKHKKINKIIDDFNNKYMIMIIIVIMVITIICHIFYTELVR